MSKRPSKKERIKKLFNKQTINSSKDTILVTHVREVGPNIKIKLSTKDKENWNVLVATKDDTGYNSIKLTRKEAREMAEELKDVLQGL